MPAKGLPSMLGWSMGSFIHCRWIVWTLTLTGVVSTAAAQQFFSDPVDKNSSHFGTMQRQWVNNPATYVADKAHFDDYFNKFYFPDMTRDEDANLGKLGDKRFNLFKQYLWATNNAQLQKDLTAMAYDKMLAIVVKQNPAYHPAVRYNAVLVLGLLDEQYGSDSPTGKRAPKPLGKANAFLVKIVAAAADDKAVAPMLVLGALVGLDRHAQFHAGLPPDSIAPMTTDLIKLVNHEKPIQNMAREAYSWIRMRAAGVLAKLGSVGDKNSVHDALIKLIATSKSLDDRCEVAGMLDKLTYKDVKLDDANTAEPLFALTRDVGAAEDKRAKSFQEQLLGGTGGRQPVGPSGSEMYPRTQVLARLTGLRLALNKTKPALAADTQKKVDVLIKAIDPAKKAAENKDIIEPKVAEAVRAMAVAISKAVPPMAEKSDKAPEKAAAAL
jgi:hypothetical protein